MTEQFNYEIIFTFETAIIFKPNIMHEIFRSKKTQNTKIVINQIINTFA